MKNRRKIASRFLAHRSWYPHVLFYMGVSENSVPLFTQWLMIIPIKWLFHWEYTQHFQTNPHQERPQPRHRQTDGAFTGGVQCQERVLCCMGRPWESGRESHGAAMVQKGGFYSDFIWFNGILNGIWCFPESPKSLKKISKIFSHLQTEKDYAHIYI